MMTNLVLLFSFVAPFANAQTTCPAGQVWSTSMGMCMTTPTCPSGQHYDSSMGMCMPDATPAPTPTCPAGQFWDTSMGTGMCMPIPAPTTFRGISRNIFSITCVTCHAAHDPDPAEAKIDLSSYASMMTCNQMTGSSHAPFIIPGDPDHSKLYIAVQTGKMPTTESGASGQPLTAAQIQNIYDWIKAGALNN